MKCIKEDLLNEKGYTSNLYYYYFSANGFKFWVYDGYQMKEAINCAIGVYKDRYTFNAMRKSAMQSDFTWKKSAEEYLSLYKSLV